MIKRTLIAAGLAASLLSASPAFASESTLAKIKHSGVVKMGYRENSIPFAFVGDDKKPRGYSVELCSIVADSLKRDLGLQNLDVKWVPVTAQSRFEALKNGEIDLECGNTTQTLSRRADFDFSMMTFVDGASLLYRKDEKPASLDEIKGQRVAVVSGTTTEKTLVADHDAALAALTDKTATAYAADRTVLISTAIVRGTGQIFDLGSEQFSYEPYGLMMRRDADFRLAVDRTLSQLYRSGEIGAILKRWFGALGAPGDGLKVMLMLNGLPE
jgi:ABC-type amino acid transport substrate-binding protein